MGSIMTAVSPYLCEKITSGDCRILVKKSAPKEVPFKAYIYATRPKKFYKCGAVRTSDELLWLANGKIEMGDGFKYWADGDEYQCLNGRIIGEFICDRIDEFYCASVPYQKENNLGYGHFVDNGVYKVNGWHEGVVFERNDRYIDSMLKNNDLKEMCLPAQEIFDYIGIGKHFYGWHISDLKIYDKPKELNEFKTPPCEKPEKACGNCKWLVKINTPDVYECECYVEDGRPITRPPSSWQYVEELRNE